MISNIIKVNKLYKSFLLSTKPREYYGINRLSPLLSKIQLL